MPRPSGHTGYRNANLCLADDAEQMIDSSRHPELRRNGCVVELGGHHLIEHLTTYRYACALGRVREREREREAEAETYIGDVRIGEEARGGGRSC